MTRYEVEVTDHAVLRYIERAWGYKTDDVKRYIAEMVAHAAEAGAANVVIDDIRYCFSKTPNNLVVVTTVMRADMEARGAVREKISKSKRKRWHRRNGDRK